ncbi:MAG TPA: FtsX-like permease family protein [Candidatus Acidoferrales bacterium]|nr:FtsX-like permease family protein [Candidatus Acidoferrales bacterium]
MDATLLLSLIVAITLLTVVVLAFKNKILFKMGVRNFSRRPKETVIIVVGLLVSTAIISGSFMAGETVNYIIEKATYDALGTIDETVVAGGQNFFTYTVYEKLTSDSNVTSHIAGISPAITVNVPSIDDITSGVTATNVQLHGINFTYDKQFGSFTLIGGTRTNATDVGSDEALINNKLAVELNAHVGDTLTVNYVLPGVAFSSHTFRVKYIAQDIGKAQYGLQKTIFLPLEVAQNLVQKPGQINEIKISNTGNVENGVFKSDEVMSAVKQSLAGASSGATVTSMKSDLLDQAHDTSTQLSNLFIMLSTFSIIAGVMLIINIFVMLAEERKSELGMARAVGMQRGHLIQMFMFEGITYSVFAAAIGSIFGLGIGAGLVNGFNIIFMSGERAMGLTLELHYSLSDIFNAFLLGVIITFITIALASFRISKLNIVEAIRNIPVTEQPHTIKRMMLLGSLLLILAIISYIVVRSNYFIDVISPSMAIFGIAFVSQKFVSQERFFTRDRVFSAAGVALVVYLLYFTMYVIDVSYPDAMLVLTLGGPLLVSGAVLIILFNSNLLLRGLSRALGRIKSLQAVLKPSIAYPLNKKFRTGMTVMMFALVIFVIVLQSIISVTYRPDIAKEGGGYDVRALSVASLSNLTAVQPLSISKAVPQDLSAQPTQLSAKLAPLNPSKLEYYDGLYTTQVTGVTINNETIPLRGPPFEFVYGIDSNFTSHATYKFLDKAKGLNSTEEVWRKLSDPHNVVVDSSYQYGVNNIIKAGDTIEVPMANGTLVFNVVGVLDETYLHGIFMGKSQMQQLFPVIEGDNLFLIKVANGINPLDVTYDLKKGYKVFGMDAKVVHDEVEQLSQQSQMVFELLEIFLSLGLIIGIASLGAITLRSIVERRRDIGMMRAMGFQQNQILDFLLIEGLFITSLGTVIGLGTGIVLSYAIYLNFTQMGKVSYNIPLMQLLIIFTIIFAAAIICTIVPARNASRMPPAEAVRYIE